MKTCALIFLFLLGACSLYSQDASKITASLNRTRPSVYLAFESVGGRKPRVKSNEDNSPRISLRLHNNTLRPVAIDADGEFTLADLTVLTLSDGGKVYALPDGAEVELCYESEAMPQLSVEQFSKIQVPKQIPSYYNCRWRPQRSGKDSVWIRPGHSVVFSVPREFLAKDLKVYTLFSYEWESENGQMKANEPHHQVYFYSTDLPGGK